MFYTYLWLREDGTPYYVGKGKGARGFSSKGHRYACPPKERIVVHPAESEAEAFENEVALIWYYGRKDLGTGCLRNLTDGGDGGPGGNRKGTHWSPETREKVVKALTGRKLTAEHCRNIGEASKDGRYHPGWPKGKPRGPESAKLAWRRRNERRTSATEIKVTESSNQLQVFD